MQLTCYIAGPMSGLPTYNFPAFDAAREYLVDEGWHVWSPADIDRLLEFDENGPPPTPFQLHTMMQLDLQTIIWQCDAVVMLPGWYKSNGARCEYYLARALGMPVYAFHPNAETKLVEIVQQQGTM